MVLPGDKMFQSQYVTAGKTRPVILHGYGNAKRAMKEGLTSLAAQGWKPMASAMVGTGADPPIWACNDWRPILGTSVDVKVLPEALTAREEQLLLSQWARIPLKKLPITHAAHTWLHEKLDLPRAGSPDCLESPHSPMKVNQLANAEFNRYFAPLLLPIEAGQAELTLLKMRVMVETMSLDALRQLNGVLLGGHHEDLKRTLWLQAVQDSFNQAPLALTSSVHLQVAYDMVAPTSYRLQVSLGNGQVMPDQEVAACATGLRPLPATAILGMSAMVLPKSGPGVPPSAPHALAIDCSGLGGHDLGGPPFDICIRTDKHGQSIYGAVCGPD